MNSVALIGRLGGDPELRYSADGKSIAFFSIAVNESHTDAKGEKWEHTNWFRVTAFALTAEIVSNYLKKGMRVGITGALRQRTFEDKDGQNRSVIEVVARSIDFLSNGNGNGTTGGQSSEAPIKYPGDLVTQVNDAIRRRKWSCDTEYFSVKWFKAGTMHLTFKRADLVGELNRRAGGNRLKAVGVRGSPEIHIDREIPRAHKIWAFTEPTPASRTHLRTGSSGAEHPPPDRERIQDIRQG